MRRSLVAAMAAAGLLRPSGALAQAPAGDPLPSWNDGADMHSERAGILTRYF